MVSLYLILIVALEYCILIVMHSVILARVYDRITDWIIGWLLSRFPYGFRTYQGYCSSPSLRRDSIGCVVPVVCCGKQ